MKTRTSLFLITFLVFTLPKVYSQIVIDNNPDITAEQLVATIVGNGVQVSNASYEGVTWARGIFSNGDSTNLGFNSGILLTNGNAQLFSGPNNTGSAGHSNGFTGWWPGFPIGANDPSLLSFDIKPLGDTLKLTYVFGSEEYNDYVNSSFTDQFRLYITGPNPQGGNYNLQNMALVPGTDIEVSINTVNNGNASAGTVPTGPCTNCAYFADNTGGLTLQYDAFTTKLTACVAVVPCETYSMYLAVWDAGDFIFDSGIAIEEGGLSSNAPTITTEFYLDPSGLTQNMVEGHVNATVVFRLPDTSYAPMTLNLEIEGSATNGIDYEEIPNHVTFEEGQDSVSFNILPLFDDLIEGDEPIVLIIENNLGCETVYDTLELIIDDYRAMEPVTTPNTIICEGQQVDVGVGFNPYWGAGYPPYTYLWEPGGFTDDTITVSPEENTTYVVTITDFFDETVEDSVQITVFPVCDFNSFSFEASLNPGLSNDVYGEIIYDTIFVILPPGTNLNSLIASFTLDEEWCTPTVNGEQQVSGITINDFSDPLVYTMWAPAGCNSIYTVVADIETGVSENFKNSIIIFPNPAKVQITISNANGWKFTMLNTMGKTVLEGSISNQNQSINISDLKPGLYFLKLKEAGNVFVKRVVICK
ncbi:MAG TPA: choice-of-anchor L domain-containing protein [Bacteroidales bacterium]|nr:choice-of-anchor L domain-containing protein [Bacteroidales bacterium]HRX96361.1 choice-of-anchor L domain-containing protein [Bacteroidales bacterium]